MARYTGAAASLSAMLDAISTAAQLNSWTEEERYTEGDNSYDVLVLSSLDGHYYYIAQDGTDIRMEISKSYTATIGWDSIPNKSGTDTLVEGLTFPLTSHAIFSSDNEIGVAMEFSAGRFRHLALGKIQKIDEAYWTGGEYIVGCVVTESLSFAANGRNPVLWTDKSSHVETAGQGKIRAEGLGGGQDYHTFGKALSGQGYALGTGLTIGLGSEVFSDVNPNSFNQRARFTPIMIFISDNGTSTPTATWIPLGYVKNARGINNQLLSDKAEDVDNPNWWIFPQVEKSTSYGTSPIDSFYHGIAYKE